jgi:ADP-ribose pyrophosphatase
VTVTAWEVLGREDVFAIPPYVAIARERIKTCSGLVVDDFYQVELATFALCVPQLATGEIITLWQYKHGPRRIGLGFPAGFVEPGEAPDAACKRELREETGYAPGLLETLGDYVDNGNQRGSLGHYFLARDCEIVAVPQTDDLEPIELRLMRPDAIDAALAAGQFSVIHHVAAWALARPRLA